MRRLLTALALIPAVLSCKTAANRSRLDSAFWSDGSQGKLIYFENGTFIVNTCENSDQLRETLKNNKSLTVAKKACNATSTAVSAAELKSKITEALLAPAESSIEATKAQRIVNIGTQVDILKENIFRLEDGISNFSEDEVEVVAPDIMKEIKNLKTELVNLEKETDALRTAANDPNKLKIIDINTTLALQSKLATNAVEQADILTDMLAEEKVYAIDASRDVTLISALSKISPSCLFGMSSGQRKTVTRGVETLDIQCEKNGGIKLLNISCTLPGYEVRTVNENQKACIFTGNLKLDTLVATDDGICGLSSNARLTCWGKTGQFPLNIDLSSKTDGLNSKDAVFGGLVSSTEQICALDRSNKLAECWPKAPSPERGQDFVSLVAGTAHFCGFGNSRNVLCWGQNGLNQIQVPKNSNEVNQVSSAGSTTCLLNKNKQIICWGKSPEKDDSDTKLNVPANIEANSISVGSNNVCAIGTSGQAICWGTRNRISSAAPTSINLSSLVTGSYEACGITTDGDLICWGDATTTPDYLPSTSLKNVRSITKSKSGANFCAIYGADKRVSCWGKQKYNKEYKISAPDDLKNVNAIAISSSGYVCASTDFGGLKCFGNTSDIPNSPNKL